LCVPKTKFDNNGGEGPRRPAPMRCGLRAGWHDGLERLCCQETDEFSTRCSRQHTSLGSGASALRPGQSHGQRTRDESIRSAFRRSRSAKASLRQLACRGCPWPVIGGARPPARLPSNAVAVANREPGPLKTVRVRLGPDSIIRLNRTRNRSSGSAQKQTAMHAATCRATCIGSAIESSAGNPCAANPWVARAGEGWASIGLVETMASCDMALIPIGFSAAAFEHGCRGAGQCRSRMASIDAGHWSDRRICLRLWPGDRHGNAFGHILPPPLRG